MKIALVCGMKQEAAILGNPDNAVVIVGAGNAEKLAAAGRDSECRALATAVRLHVERRVFLNDSKTVIFG